ncbi:MAG: hypothetical protein AB8B73_05550 [Ekhidna sp.]
MKSQWLFSKYSDLLILFLPVWGCWAIAFLLPDYVLLADIPLWVWVVVVIGIDVSHVWSSIHRTYFDREEFSHHRKLFIIAPILSFLLSFGLAAISIDLFWRCLAYVAVFHFVKQQFGFMRIYKAKALDFRSKILSDNFIIYLSMLYPVLYWHMQPDLEFAWFTHGDFVQIPDFGINKATLLLVGNLFYFVLIVFWLIEEVYSVRKTKEPFPIGKTVWVLTTAGNWYLGIVYFNSDLVFTITNVVAHGIPYFALVLFYQTKKKAMISSNHSFRRTMKISLFIVISVMLFAFLEEYLWDVMLYRDNVELFESILIYPKQIPSVTWQLIAIGVLAVPQVTHYILDGFIWKANDKNPYLKKIFFN